MLKRGLMCALAIASLAIGSAPAQPALGPAAIAPPPAASPAQARLPGEESHSLTKDDAAAWLDGYMPFALARGNMAGAVVVIVKDGQVLVQKGYGYADIASRKPIDPENTLFRPGSVSKLFTWTAVMQQVEQGKIKLDQDVNTYLDFTIPPFRGQPVTMRNLMTHTAGFEETNKDLVFAEPVKEPGLDNYLKLNLPERIFTAGKIPSYSNYGAALAGYIVQRVSGEAFDDYIEKHIFLPLGMQHSSFRQPLPPSLRKLMASGYEDATGPAQPVEVVGPAPAGSSSVSGADMARFMIAHLQDGQFNDRRILQPDTAKEMHSTALNNIPPLNSMLLGFYQMNRNGHRIIGHGGDTQWFHSELSLFLDDNVGLFISMNSVGTDGAAGPIRRALRESFADRYFPGPAPDGHPDQRTVQTDANTIAGTYITSRRDETSFFSLLYYLMETATVSTDGDGKIIASDQKDFASQLIHFIPIDHLVWRDDRGKMRIGALMDSQYGLLWTNDESPYEVNTRVPWFKDSAWMVPALVTTLVAFLLTALSWPVNALYRRRYRVALSLQGAPLWAYRLTRAATLLDAALMFLWPTTLVYMLKIFALNGEFDGFVHVLHVLTIVIFPLAALVLLWNAWLVWNTRGGFRAWFAKAWSIVLALGGLLVLWSGFVFHLIGVGLRY
jgi:CubicO group peptidase (beta-lactamase class C family)